MAAKLTAKKTGRYTKNCHLVGTNTVLAQVVVQVILSRGNKVLETADLTGD